MLQSIINSFRVASIAGKAVQVLNVLQALAGVCALLFSARAVVNTVKQAKALRQ